MKDLGLAQKNRITVLNKIDLLLENNKTFSEDEALKYFMNSQTEINENVFFVSAFKKWGLTNLLKHISKYLVDIMVEHAKN